MPPPVISYTSYLLYGCGILANFWFYAYNYNTLTANIRFRNTRYFFPLINAIMIGHMFYKYNNSILRVNMFDEYNWLRAQELVEQNEYLFKHEGNRRNIQTSRDSFGGARTSRRLWTESIDKRMIMRPQTSRTPSSSSKILLTDTWILRPGILWENSQKPSDCDKKKYNTIVPHLLACITILMSILWGGSAQAVCHFSF